MTTAGINEFGGFDRRESLTLWRFWTRYFNTELKEWVSETQNTVFVVERLAIDARTLAELYFNKDYSQVEGVEDERPSIAPGEVVLAKDPQGGYFTLETTGETPRASVLRGAGLRFREPVALEGGRQDPPLLGRGEKDGQEPVHPQANGVAEDRSGGTPRRKGSSPRSRAR